MLVFSLLLVEYSKLEFFHRTVLPIGSEWNKTVGWFKEKWGFATSIFVETETPYFLTLGNHDDEVGGFIVLDRSRVSSTVKRSWT